MMTVLSISIFFKNIAAMRGILKETLGLKVPLIYKVAIKLIKPLLTNFDKLVIAALLG